MKLYALRDVHSNEWSNFFTCSYDEKARNQILGWFDSNLQDNRHFDWSSLELYCVANIELGMYPLDTVDPRRIDLGFIPFKQF